MEKTNLKFSVGRQEVSEFSQDMDVGCTWKYVYAGTNAKYACTNGGIVWTDLFCI